MIIRKNKEALLSLILTMVMTLSSCGVKTAPLGNDSSNEIAIEDTIEYGDYYETKLLKKQALDDFKSYLESISVEYRFKNHYLSEQEITDLITLSQDDHKCTKRYNRDVNPVISRIRDNSQAFVDKNNHEFSSAFITGDGNKDREVFEKALYYALTVMMEEENDLNEDIHRMEDLKIVFGDGNTIYSIDTYKDIKRETVVLGYYDNRINLIVIDPDAIRVITEAKGTIKGLDTHYDTMLSTIMHELNHVRQTVCDCRYNANEKLLGSVKYGEISSGLTEASAESELYNLNKFPFDKYRNSYDYSYTNERDEEAMILLMALFNDKAKIEDYYQAIFDTDYQSLYNFLDLRSREDIELFYNILYSMDAILYRNDLVLNAYSDEEKKGKTLYDFRCDLGYDYLIDLFRFVLDRMSTYAYNHTDMTLSDNVILLNVIEDIICSMAFTIGNSESETYLNFRSNLQNMDHAYKVFLSNVYNVTLDDINKEISDTNDIEFYLDDRANGSYYFGSSINKKCDALFEKFPILKSIVRQREYYHGNYERVITDDDLSFKLK